AEVLVVVSGSLLGRTGARTVEQLAGGRRGGAEGLETLDRHRQLGGMERRLIAVEGLLLRVKGLALPVMRDLRLQLAQHLVDRQVRTHGGFLRCREEAVFRAVTDLPGKQKPHLVANFSRSVANALATLLRIHQVSAASL